MKTRKLVLTGGPCAGKTTIAAVLGKAFESHVALVPEAASLLFRGGFPRWPENDPKESLQRSIYQVQKSLELAYGSHFLNKLLILDRGTVDGAAYWPNGTTNFFDTMKTTLEDELMQYSCVIYLSSPEQEHYEQNKSRNPVRTESWEEACRLDQDTKALWSKHPRFQFIQNQTNFSDKIFAVLQIIERELSIETI